MVNVVADIYVILSVTTIILFILTRTTVIRVVKQNEIIISLEFSLIKLEFIKDDNDQKVKPPDVNSESEISPDFGEIFSLLTLLLRYLQKSTITVRHFTLPYKICSGNMFSHFGFKALMSAAIAYIESNVEKLIIHDNAFTLSSDNRTKFDIDLKIMLFDLIVLIFKLIFKGIKIGRSKKADVGN